MQIDKILPGDLPEEINVIIEIPIDISFNNIKDINKDLEKGKWVKILGWEGIKTAKKLIEEGVKEQLI